MNGCVAHSNPTFDAILPAPFGGLGVRVRSEKLSELVFLPTHSQAASSTSHTPFMAEISRQLAAYFADSTFRFNLPLHLDGTPFRLRVWHALQDIRIGRTLTYGELAHLLDSSPRAVGQALGDNPIPIILPCHRIVAAKGLGGFNHQNSDFFLDVKRWLLKHEHVL